MRPKRARRDTPVTLSGVVPITDAEAAADLRRNHGQPVVDAPTFFWSEQARR